MKLMPLLEVTTQLKVGSPLAFSIRDAEGNLLLARGHLVDSQMALDALLQRGATVDVEEVAHTRRTEVVVPPAENFPGKWHQLTVRASVLLRPPLGEDFVERLHELIAQLIDMADRDPDMLLYLALRSARDPGVHYGALHALHASVVMLLVARRMHWDGEQQVRAMSTALTMNLSCAELQSRLHGSKQPLTTAQREVIDRHPEESAALLRGAGIEDAAWLEAVTRHHATTLAPDAPPLSELTRLLQLVDGYCTRITERADTIIASPALAARDLFAHHAKDPFALSLVKEMGLYPPGCFVRIASGETAVSLRRGTNANAPLVACLTNKRGDALQQPIRRDTSILAEHAITQVVPDREVKVRMPSQQLYA
jgi:hypothetical protein